MNNKRVNTGITQVLYEDNSYAKECESEVLECKECAYFKGEKEERAYALVLDKTVFFPEGGGQPADEGWLSIQQKTNASADAPRAGAEISRAISGSEERLQVLDVQKENGVILHYVSYPIPVGSKIKAELDWNLRYERMQNHSGEHLFCGLIHKLYGYENVGFHMSKDCVTVDVNGVLTAEDFEKLEKTVQELLDKEL